MKYTALAATLLIATSSAYAIDVRINTALQLAGVESQADVQASADLKAKKEAAAKAAVEAKAAGEAAMSDAKANAALKVGAGQTSTASFKQNAAMKISVSDRLALAKYYASNKATSSFFGSFFGASDANAPAAGYESALVLGAKLDSSVAKSAVAVDSSVVSKLSTQPKGTNLLKVGDHIVRVDTKTQVVLDVAAISPK